MPERRFSGRIRMAPCRSRPTAIPCTLRHSLVVSSICHETTKTRNEKSCCESAFGVLCFRGRFDTLPLFFQLVQRHLSHRAARLRDGAFERPEARTELVVRLAQRSLGLDAQLARQVRDRKQQVAHLFLCPLLVDRRGA